MQSLKSDSLSPKPLDSSYKLEPVVSLSYSDLAASTEGTGDCTHFSGVDKTYVK